MNTNADQHPESSLTLDDRIKQIQLEKLQAELRNLKSWNYELTGKVLISFIAVVLAGWSLYLGVPRAQYDALKATEEAASMRDHLNKLKTDVTGKTLELKESTETLTAKLQQLADANDALARTQNALQTAKSSLTGEALARAEAAPRPLIYVQFAGSLSRDLIDAYRAALSNAGFSPPRAERINRGQKNEVRYFTNSPQESMRAAVVAKATEDFFERKGCPLSPPIQTRYVQLPSDRQSPQEVWLIGSCP